MSTPPLLRRQPTPLGNRRMRDPVVTVTAALLSVVIVGLLVLAVIVVSTYGILENGQPAQEQTLSAGFVAPFALVLAVVFFATVAINVLAAAVRHFRTGR